MEAPHDPVRSQLKILLLHLAAKAENPGLELQKLLQEVLGELHGEVKQRLKPKLKVVKDESAAQQG